MVDMILNQAGLIKYDMKQFDFKGVVAEVVEAHQGKVWEDTEVGKGSTFYVKLPRGS